MSTATVETMSIDWSHWLGRWDRQQAGYMIDREGRFATMLNAVAGLLPEEFVAVDLCCGPGSMSKRLLDRFPRARVVALDLDPVLLAMGQGVYGDGAGRLRWVEADLKTSDWVEKLGETQVDAVLSTTALHWLPAPVLVEVYRALGLLVREGGVFLNGDNLCFSPDLPSFQKLGEIERQQYNDERHFATLAVDNWKGWWDALSEEPAAQPLLAERERRFGWMKEDWAAPNFDVHIAALKDAGFREVGTIWQHLTNRIVMAVR